MAMSYEKIIREGSAVLLLLILLLCTSVPTRADYPIDVQKLEAEGDYYKAMLAFERMPKRVATTQALLSAAESAWALSLPQHAIERYEKALHDQSLSNEERARIELTRGVIELQEGNPQTAIVFSERALSRLTSPSGLRGKVWLLFAESLMKLNAAGQAEEKYKRAQAEVDVSEKAEVDFLLARCQLILGRTHEAIENYARIPLNHERTAEAIRSLSLLSLNAGDYSQALFWLETGKSKFPEKFLDSWVEYAILLVATKDKNLNKVREIRDAAVAKFPPSDPWLTLLEAKAEAFLWENRQIQGVGNERHSN
jgi:tetratricopeptide (TPR) repeat protein